MIPETPPSQNRHSIETPPKRLQPAQRLTSRLWQRVVLALMRGATGAIQRLPRPAAMRFGSWLGTVAYRLARRQRRFADRNLRIARPELKRRRTRQRLTRKVFRHFGKSVVDFLRGPLFTEREMARLITAEEGYEHLQTALDQGRGVIILTAHLGNWELLGRWLATRGVPLTAVAKEPRDPALAAYLKDMRESAGFTVVNKGESARDLLRALRGGGAVILLADQNSGDVFVPFFGVPAGTVAGPAALALRTGAAIVPAYCVRQQGDTYRIQFLPPIAAVDTGNREADVLRVTTEVSHVLEEMVRLYPEQWLWLHNRWKSAFEEKNRQAWTGAFDFESAQRRWKGRKPHLTSAGKG